MPYIGIDFGTSNSVVANFQFGQAEVVPNHEGQKWTPSIVTMRRDGTLAFGQEAKENFDEQRSIRSIKRILGTPERVPFVGQNLMNWLFDGMFPGSPTLWPRMYIAHVLIFPILIALLLGAHLLLVAMRHHT